MDQEEINECAKEYIKVKQKSDAYHYLGLEDEYLVKLFHWVHALENLKEEVQESGGDKELEQQVGSIVGRMLTEIGLRMVMIFP